MFNINKSNWREHVILTQEGYPKASSVQNVLLVLQYDESLEGVFTRDDGGDVIISRRPPWNNGDGDWIARPATKEDYTSCRAFLEYLGLKPTASNLVAAIKATAKGDGPG